MITLQDMPDDVLELIYSNLDIKDTDKYTIIKEKTKLTRVD